MFFCSLCVKNDKRKKNLFFLYVGKVTACFNYVDNDDHHQRENEKRKRAFVHVSIFVLRLIEEKKKRMRRRRGGEFWLVQFT